MIRVVPSSCLAGAGPSGAYDSIVIECQRPSASDEPATGNYFVSTYPPFSCWRSELLDVYRRRLAEAQSPSPELGVYLHIPFCADRCHYCYYLSHDRRFSDMDAYIEAVSRELDIYRAEPRLAGRSADFVYLGGGTPSILPATRLLAVLHVLRRAFPFTRAREVCVECAPRSATSDRLAALRDAGVTRLSLGVQQLNDVVLEKNGRIHAVADVERAFAHIRGAGFDHVNLDLMAGLVGETEESFLSSLERVIELAPESVTIYPLEIPQNTPLFRALPNIASSDAPVGWDVKRARIAAGFERLARAGYSQRSAYAAVRDPWRHRFVYQEAQYAGADLLGIGVSSFSYLGGVNQQNLTSLDAYLRTVGSGALPLGRAYELSPRERFIREFVLQLKLGQVDCRRLEARHATATAAVLGPELDSAVREGLITVDAHAIRVTPDARFSVDRWLQRFYEPAHRGVRYS